jgi:hypothetical protein
MSGRVNIVFGFFWLTITAILGPLVLIPAKGENIAKLKAAEEAVKTTDAGALAAIAEYLSDANRLGFISGAAHAHGNLEALLNIVAGVVLLTIAVRGAVATVLGALFIAGAFFHSGMLYLAFVFGVAWAGNLSIIGVASLIAGIFLTGVATLVYGVKNKDIA